MITIDIRTWRCPDCDYAQDFDPNDPASMGKHFPGVEVGHCPACFTGQNPTRNKKNIKLSKVTDPAKKSKVNVPEDTDIDAMEVEEIEDSQGKSKKVPLSNERKNEMKAEARASLVAMRELEDK